MANILLGAFAVVLFLAGGAWYVFGGDASSARKFSGEPVSLSSNNQDAHDTAPSSHRSPEGEAGVEAQSEAITPNQIFMQVNDIVSATLHTNKGDITIEFMSADAPKTVENFTKLAQSGFYDGTKFHRVISGFMVQGGDPLSKDDAMSARWGTGGPGYQFADEIHANNKNDIGTISMANAGPNTNGSQFFINTAANNFLDGKHTVFGKVVAGMDVVKAIEATPTGQNDRPASPMIIQSITFK